MACVTEASGLAWGSVRGGLWPASGKGRTSGASHRPKRASLFIRSSFRDPAGGHRCPLLRRPRISFVTRRAKRSFEVRRADFVLGPEKKRLRPRLSGRSAVLFSKLSHERDQRLHTRLRKRVVKRGANAADGTVAFQAVELRRGRRGDELLLQILRRKPERHVHHRA